MLKHFLICILCVLWSLVFPITKILLQSMPPLLLTGSRMLLASFLFFGYLLCTNQNLLKISFQHLPSIMIVSITGIYLTNALEAWGLQYLASAKACFIYSFTPIFMAAVSYFYFSEKITPKKYVGLALGVLGFLPMLMEQADLENNLGKIWFFSFAEIALFSAAIATSIGFTVLRGMVKKHRLAPITANLYTMFIGGILLMIHSAVSESWTIAFKHSEIFFGWFVGLILISNILAYNLHAYLLKSVTSTYLSFTQLSMPFITALFGFWLLAEILSSYFWFSVIAVSLGLILYYQEELRQGYIQKKTSADIN